MKPTTILSILLFFFVAITTPLSDANTAPAPLPGKPRVSGKVIGTWKEETIDRVFSHFYGLKVGPNCRVGDSAYCNVTLAGYSTQNSEIETTKGYSGKLFANGTIELSGRKAAPLINGQYDMEFPATASTWSLTDDGKELTIILKHIPNAGSWEAHIFHSRAAFVSCETAATLSESLVYESAPNTTVSEISSEVECVDLGEENEPVLNFPQSIGESPQRFSPPHEPSKANF